MNVHFLVADVLRLPDLRKRFDFFFERGCYHAVRRGNSNHYAAAVAQQLAADARGLILAGNSREPYDPGPPVVSEHDLHTELGQKFRIIELREFRFDEAPGVPQRFLGWSCLVQKL